MVKKSFVETIVDLRAFVNRKDVPANHVAYLLGKPLTAHMFGAMRVKPYDTRFSSILVNMKPQNFNVLRFVTFTCAEGVSVGLADLEQHFGHFVATYNEEKNFTLLEYINPNESELFETFVATIQGFKLENTEGGLLLHQPGQRPVTVPLSEMLIPEFTWTFREWERPADKSGKNPIYQ